MSELSQLIKLKMVSQNDSHKNASFHKGIVFVGVMSLAEEVIRHAPKVFSKVRKLLCKRFKKKLDNLQVIQNHKNLLDESVKLNVINSLNSVLICRRFNNETCESNLVADSIIECISTLKNVPMLQMIKNGAMMVSYKEKPIQMTNDIFIKVMNVDMNEDGDISKLTFCLQSNTLSAAEMLQYIRKIHNKCMLDKKNELAGKVFYFDQKNKDSDTVPQIKADMDPIEFKKMNIKMAPKFLNFTMSEFHSNKTFDNIFGDEVKLVKKRVEFFCNNKDWYDKKGIPYQLGLLLSGIPGSGKTSIIKAIANQTNRHIINVNFANIQTASQLKNLFFSDKINVFDDTNCSSSKSFHLPTQEKLFVLEEIDTLGEIVQQRNHEKNVETVVNDELTIGEILNVLDGTQEIPGRIVIMTSNHPEVLDKALIRPGRIDVPIYFGNASINLIKELYKSLTEKDLPDIYDSEIPTNAFSPAEISQMIFKHLDSDNIDIDFINDLQNSFKERQFSSQTIKTQSKETLVEEEEKQVKEQTHEFVNDNDCKDDKRHNQNNDISCTDLLDRSEFTHVSKKHILEKDKQDLDPKPMSCNNDCFYYLDPQNIDF